MARKERLSKLHNIKVGARIKVITMDMGLQYEYVTSHGHGESMGNTEDWLVYKFNLSK